MDLGCYSLHSMRVLASFGGGEPALVSATGGERQGHPGVDEWVTAELQFPNGVTGTAGCNMASDHHQMSHRLIGTAGEAVSLANISRACPVSARLIEACRSNNPRAGSMCPACRNCSAMRPIAV